jgi:uncharacterized membrane protein YcaP (DUF421 family)
MIATSFFFNGWDVLWRTLISGLCAYFAMVLLLRRSGKHTLSQMTPFDMIVPLTLGPILASMILLPNVALVQGLFAFGLLVSLHSFVAWLRMRSERVRQWLEPEPALLLHRGVFLKKAMRRERVTESEILEAVRAEGLSSITDAEAVVLEADGSYNVIRHKKSKEVTSLEDVSGYQE